MSCSSGCLTPGVHKSWGECVKAKSLRVAYCNSASGQDFTAQKRWDAELDLYASARRQGIQPESTRTPDIRAAIELSNDVGVGYNPRPSA